MTESGRPQPSASDAEWLHAWKTTEEVAMHFNDLIMNFRLKAIGGITAAAGVFGTILLSKGDVATTAQNFRLFAAAAFLLVPVWFAVAWIDLAYYQKLLRGAVDEALRLEESTKGRIELSTRIEAAVNSSRLERDHRMSRRAFYVLPGIALVAAGTLALCAASRPEPTESGRTPAAAPSKRDG